MALKKPGPVTVIQVFDWYHCTGCNCRVGTRTVLSDGTDETLADVNVDCFHPAYTTSYEVERFKHWKRDVEAKDMKKHPSPMVTTTHVDPPLDGLHLEIDGRYQANQDDPETWDLRLIMADLYEQRGDDQMALAIRWQVKRKKRPYLGGLDNLYCWFDESQVRWETYSTISSNAGCLVAESKPLRRRWDPRSDLPYRLWRWLEAACLPLPGYDAVGKNWYTRRQAEEALWAAWKIWKGLTNGKVIINGTG